MLQFLKDLLGLNKAKPVELNDVEEIFAGKVDATANTVSMVDFTEVDGDIGSILGDLDSDKITADFDKISEDSLWAGMSQRQRVAYVMSSGHWYTIEELAQTCGGKPTSISARIRDLRKEKFGGHTVNKRKVDTDGVIHYEYQLNLAKGVHLV